MHTAMAARPPSGPRRQAHRFRGILAAAAAIGVVAATATLPSGRAAGVVAQNGPYYVAVGASESVGVQPSPGTRRGKPTDDGYANDVAAMEQHRWPGLQLEEYGCPGITVQAALDGGSRCTYPRGSEVRTAVSFLRAHRGRTVLITVDLGFNDVWPCLTRRHVDSACVAGALASIARTLPVVVHRLRAAAGPRTAIVGLEHDDPYLARFLHGLAGRVRAHADAAVVARLNRELADIYRGSGVLVADVPRAFGTAETDPTHYAGAGSVPYGVVRTCRLTWMCVDHNVHPNDAGYRAIARAVEAALAAGPRLS